MKVRNNIINALMAVLVAATIWSCDDDVEYTPAEQAPVAETQVYFIQNETSEFILSKEATSFTVVVGRANNSSAQSVPLKVTNPNNTIFTSIPETVEFAAGESEKEITIQVSNEMPFFKSYPLQLEIPAEYVNPYIEQTNHPVLALNVSKEDYSPYAVGTYYSWWYEETWEQVLEYSEYLGTYRFADLWVEGVDVEFSWDGSAKVTFPSSTLVTGIVHPSYGAVSAKVLAQTQYVAAQNTFYLAFQWTVSAGSFGSAYDTFTITELK